MTPLQQEYQAANDDDAPVPPRSLDTFLQAAYDSTAATACSSPGVKTKWQQIQAQWRYMLIIVALGISSAADASEMFSIGYILGDPGFQEEILNGDLTANGAIVAAILNLGLIFGGITAGSSEGRLGRRYIMLIGLLITAAAGFGCSIVPRSMVGVFALCRFIAGLGIGPILASTAPLATELSPPRERGLVVSVANSFWTVGLIANAIFAFFIFGVYNMSWRVFVAICTLPSVIGYVMIWALVPESPRFLALQGQYDRAAKSANRIALALGYRGSLIQDSEIEYHFTLTTRRASQIIRQPTGIREKFERGVNLIRLVYKKDLRKPTLTIQTLWIAASVGGSIGQWLVTIFHKIGVQNIYHSFIFLNCACIPGNIASAVLTDRIGRNKFFSGALFMGSFALFGTALVVVRAGDDLASKTISVVICASFFYASMTGVYSCLYVMASELFPTNVRSTGVALCSAWGRIATMGSMFINGALVDTPAVLLVVGASVMLAGSFMSVIFPPNEMKLKPVQDEDASSASEVRQSSIVMQEQQLPLSSLPQEIGSVSSANNRGGRRVSEVKYLAG